MPTARSDPRMERWATGTGVAFVFFAAVAYLLAPNLPKQSDSTEEALGWFADNHDRVLWQSFLFGVATISFIWFFGTVASRLRRAENDPAGRLPAVVVIAAGASAALFMFGAASFAAVAKMEPVGGAPVGRVGIERPLFELGNMAFAFTNFAASALVAAIALGILRTRLLPDWVAWAGAAFVVLSLVDVAGYTIGDSAVFGAGGVFGILTFLVFLVWTLATSVLLWQATPVGRTTAAERPPPPPS